MQSHCILHWQQVLFLTNTNDTQLENKTFLVMTPHPRLKISYSRYWIISWNGVIVKCYTNSDMIWFKVFHSTISRSSNKLLNCIKWHWLLPTCKIWLYIFIQSQNLAYSTTIAHETQSGVWIKGPCITVISADTVCARNHIRGWMPSCGQTKAWPHDKVVLYLCNHDYLFLQGLVTSHPDSYCASTGRRTERAPMIELTIQTNEKEGSLFQKHNRQSVQKVQEKRGLQLQ